MHKRFASCHRELEQVVRQHPDQYLWVHRRFKTRPPGEASVYREGGS
jgi:lauroyl/myristoyl acyltransferase